MNIKSVILSGGNGSRLWPVSREAYPKQLLPLVGEKSLLQETVMRTQCINPAAQPLIVCNEQHRFIVASQLQEINATPDKIILEPFGRNTAPAVALAAFHLSQTSPDTIMLVMPADHVITDAVRFMHMVQEAASQAESGYLMTFGIKPSKPETGYGYIKRGKSISENCYAVEQFLEKPNITKAEALIAAGDCFWNSGIFLFTAKTYLDALNCSAPEIYRACEEIFNSRQEDVDFLRFNENLFTKCPSNSIDYAVMEHSENIAVVPYEGEWNDVGAWDALHDLSNTDKDGNVLRGDVLSFESKNCYLRSESRMLVSIGVNDLIMVETDDAVLVADKAHCQDVKLAVEQLKLLGREEHITHKKVERPWGSYESLISGDRFQVKKITVKPRGRLSLQMHYHRSEHWVVVDGTALVTKGDESFVLSENQSTYIPVGVVHRLENPGKTLLHIIEVQSGSYLGEDDIVRMTDDYGRVEKINSDRGEL